MISPAQARNRIQGLADDQVKELVRRRLLGTDTTPTDGGYFEEQPQDLVCGLLLLSTNDIAPTTREAIVKGCRDIYGKALAWLTTCQRPAPLTDEAQVLLRVSDVADVTAADELESPAMAALELAVKEPLPGEEILRACVRAGMSYTKRGEDWQVRYWERVLCIEPVAAYAFNALLEIDPQSTRLERALEELWIKQINDNWRVNTAVLMRRTARARQSNEWMSSFLASLQSSSQKLTDDQSLWSAVEKELEKRPWSKPWLNLDRTTSIEYVELQLDWFDLSALVSSPNIEMIVNEYFDGATEKYCHQWTFCTDISDFSSRVKLNHVASLIQASSSTRVTGIIPDQETKHAA